MFFLSLTHLHSLPTRQWADPSRPPRRIEGPAAERLRRQHQQPQRLSTIQAAINADLEREAAERISRRSARKEAAERALDAAIADSNGIMPAKQQGWDTSSWFGLALDIAGTAVSAASTAATAASNAYTATSNAYTAASENLTYHKPTLGDPMPFKRIAKPSEKTYKTQLNIDDSNDVFMTIAEDGDGEDWELVDLHENKSLGDKTAQIECLQYQIERQDIRFSNARHATIMDTDEVSEIFQKKRELERMKEKLEKEIKEIERCARDNAVMDAVVL